MDIMKTKYSPSINIIRDEQYDLNYIVTPNAKKLVEQINDLYNRGFHSFNIIGSYGTGKSSFLWAFEKSLKGEREYFNLQPLLSEELEIINIVGEFESFKSLLADKLNLPPRRRSNNDIIQKMVSKFSSNKLLLLVVDEFGKLLEYAIKNNVEEEIYFLQQLAEVFNNTDHNGIFITTLHQSFEAYGHVSLNEAGRNEWVKVKGRFKDLTFNEPVEQLLLLAANNIELKSKIKNIPVLAEQFLKYHKQYHITHLDSEFSKEIALKLWPLDIISAYLLCVALQRYGQNERSLFTFLESEFDTISKHQNDSNPVGIPEIYDYLFHEFYSYLNSKYNTDYTTWSMILLALDRVDADFIGEKAVAVDIVKVIGFVNLFGHRGAHIEDGFITGYLSYLYNSDSIKAAIEELKRIKVLRFNRFSQSYKITQGTDINIESELLQVAEEIETKLDIAHKLEEYFDFSVVNAKAVSYRTGTPRFFQYLVTDQPISEMPNDRNQIDGVINLVFDTKLDIKGLRDVSSKVDDVLYASFLKISDIRETIYDIEKTNQIITKYDDDKVAIKELQSIIGSLRGLLNHQVIDALFTQDVEWFYLGKKVHIPNKKVLNKRISLICEKVYSHCPTFNNELINRHSVSANIANAKKILFDKLVSNYHIEDLGFSKDLFPAEKTIYLTMLKNTGIHRKEGDLYSLGQPSDEEFLILWEHSEKFIQSAKNERQKISAFYEQLSKKPFKLTSGFLEFWIPIFLFIRRDDYALFSKKEGYLPEITESILYLFTRTAADYEIKSFDVKGIKLDLFNKYREFLQLKDADRVNNVSLIESIKPFLVFYRDLNSYTQNTKRLSKETIKIRETIKGTQDPEKLFFEEFPKAMNMSLSKILKSERHLEDYVNGLRICIKEIRSCFDELVNRIEKFLVEEVLQSKGIGFEAYKTLIMQRYDKLKEHMLLPQQSSLLIRLKSPIDDRNSWINSICQVLLGKNLDSIKDTEEKILKEKIKTSFNELDNLVSIADIHEERVDQEVMKLQLTSFKKGMLEETLLIPREVSEEVDNKLKELSKSLGTSKKMNLYLLMSLLKKELDE